MKKYYVIGIRPVYVEFKNSRKKIYSYNWSTGDFDEDFSYYGKIFHGPDTDETTEIEESDFFNYVEKLKTEASD